MNNFSNAPQQGWICPRCGKVNAPWMPQCNCEAKQEYIASPPRVGAPYYQEPSITCETDLPQEGTEGFDFGKLKSGEAYRMRDGHVAILC